MSRLHTFLVVGLVITTSIVVHLVAVAMFPQLDDSLDDPNGDTFNQEQIQDEIYIAISVWVPVIMDIGVIIWAVVREYRRQRVTAVSGGF